jgi:lysozyme family protein
MEIILAIVLAVFAAAAILVWWMLDIDIADMVATVGAPLAGIAIIYWYGTPIAWAVGLVLIAIGGFGLYYLVKRRPKPPWRDV